jgi:integrase
MGMLTIAGKVIRVPGQGLLRVDETKSAAGRRTIPLPRFAVEILQKRRLLPYLGERGNHLPVHSRHPSRPEQLPEAAALGTGRTRRPGCNHSQSPQDRRALIDDEGLSARIGADHLGHSHVSMTQDRYMTRGRIHTQVADLLDRTVRINDE